MLVLLVGVLGSTVVGVPAQAQIPGLPVMPKPPSAPASAKSDAQEKPVAAPTTDNAQATVATTSGPIDVEKPVDDAAVQATLSDLLPNYPGVRSASVKSVNFCVESTNGSPPDRITSRIEVSCARQSTASRQACAAASSSA